MSPSRPSKLDESSCRDVPVISVTKMNHLEPVMKKKRTRARLDHLSQEEKLERRKEKNRQAAQTARDRKKTIMEIQAAQIKELQREIALLRQQIGNQTATHSCLSPSQDSGVSDGSSSNSRTPDSSVADATEMDCSNSPNPTSSNELCSPSPAPTDIELIDEMIMLKDEKLEEYCLPSIDVTIKQESAPGVSPRSAVPNSSLPQACTPSKFLSVENSLGWTSFQIMTLLMIAGVHHRYSEKTHCCQRPQRGCSSDRTKASPPPGNLYDYINQTRCEQFQGIVESIISNKNDTLQQRLAAWEFARKYLKDNRVQLDKVHRYCFPGGPG